jgi:hypothetical protein
MYQRQKTLQLNHSSYISDIHITDRPWGPFGREHIFVAELYSDHETKLLEELYEQLQQGTICEGLRAFTKLNVLSFVSHVQ